MRANQSKNAFRCIKEESNMVEIKDQALLKEIQSKLDRKMRENEIAVLEYWKEQLDRVVSMKPEGIASLQLHIKKIAEMMSNRVKILKRN